MKQSNSFLDNILFEGKLLKSSLKLPLLNYNEKDFFEMYHSMTSIYDEEAQNDIKSVLVPIMLQTDSLSLLSVSTTGEGRWLLSHQDALKRCAEVVSTWKYDKLSEFLNRYSSSSLFYGKPDFQGIIVDKAIEIIQDNFVYFNDIPNFIRYNTHSYIVK